MVLTWLGEIFALNVWCATFAIVAVVAAAGVVVVVVVVVVIIVIVAGVVVAVFLVLLVRSPVCFAGMLLFCQQ